MAKITVKNTDVTIIRNDDNDYISLTDIARFKSDDPTAVIANWLRNRNTLEYLGIWESLYNPDFKPLEFEGFKKQAGLNAFTLSPAELTSKQVAIIYADEADVLNVALFGVTAREWKDKKPDKKGNIRDYASINEAVFRYP